jgi:hypothetical protein
LQHFFTSAPAPIGPCCHGNDETKAYAGLCQVGKEMDRAFWKATANALPEPLAVLELAMA